MEKQVMVQEIVFSHGYFPEKYSEFVSWLDKQYRKVPEELRDSVRITVEKEYDYGDSVYANLQMIYRRPENEKEKAARLTQKEWLESQRREQYERMKKEFGDA